MDVYFIRFYDSLWDGWFRGDEDDVQNMIIKKKFRRKSFTTGAGQPQNIQLGSTHGYFIKSPWLQDGIDRSQLERTDKSVDKFLQAVINDRHGHGY